MMVWSTCPNSFRVFTCLGRRGSDFKNPLRVWSFLPLLKIFCLKPTFLFTRSHAPVASPVITGHKGKGSAGEVHGRLCFAGPYALRMHVGCKHSRGRRLLREPPAQRSVEGQVLFERLDCFGMIFSSGRNLVLSPYV